MMFILSIALILFTLVSCTGNPERLFKETRSAMYTVTSITVSAPNESIAKEAIEASFAELKSLESILNYYSPTSEVSSINSKAGIKPVKVSKDTIEIIEKAQIAAELTDGGFDITLGPVISLWDFKRKVIPSREIINAALRQVGYKGIILNRSEGTVFLKKKGMEINLGGIIKGYAADKVIEILKQRGIKGAIVSVGGDIKAYGLRPEGKLWNVGIQNPRPIKDKDELIGTLAISEGCISTSGDYERFFESGGIRYHHIINPKTGFPSEGIRSITVIASEGALCDALATGFFALGERGALQRMQQAGIKGIVIDSTGVIKMTNETEVRFTRTQ